MSLAARCATLVLLSTLSLAALADTNIELIDAPTGRCDVEPDGDVDFFDLQAIFEARNTLPDGPDDPRDADGSGIITIADVRVCTKICTNDDCSEPSKNTPPVADAGDDQTVTVGDTVTLDGSGSSDADGDPLSYSWSFVSIPAGSAANLSDPAAVMPLFVADVAGDYNVRLVVNDGTVDSPPDDVIVVTAPGNTPPVADAGPDQLAEVNEVVTLDGSGSFDVDGDTLTYSWGVVSLPTGSAASLSDPTTVMPTFTVDVIGDYVFELVVDDGQAASTPDSVTVTTSNPPPVADAGPDQTVRPGDLVQLDGSGSSDPNGDPLTYAWSLTSAPPGSAAALDDPAAEFPSFTADVVGTYVAQLIVNDGNSDSAPDTVVIDSFNTRPVADAGPNQTATIGDTVTLDGTGSSDADGDALTYDWALTSRPTGSAAALDDDTSQTPAFEADVEGLYVGQLTVNDGFIDSIPDSTVVTVEVAANNPPVANDDLATTDEDTFVDIDVLANDTDADGDTLTIVPGGAAPANGTVGGDGSGGLRYTPDPDFNGTDTFDYVVSDGTDTDTGTVTVTVNPINDDPVAADDNATTSEDIAVDIDVLANDSDVDGDTLTVADVTQASNGSVTNNGGNVTYTPDTNFTGIDTFTYTVDDGNGGQDIATVTVDVGGTNDDPVANDDAATTDEDVAVTIPVLANDSDPDGDTLSVDSVTDGANGTVVTDGTTATYTPAANFNGVDTFTYTVSDGNGGTDSATVTVTVEPVNDDPVAVDDSAATDEETLVSIDVLANDTDVDGDALTIQSVQDPANGTAVINAGQIDYTPDAGFDGNESFDYTVSDGNGGTDTATVTVSVAVVNDPPNAVDDTATTDEDVAVTIDVLANDDDPDGDSLTIQSVTQGANGSVTNNGGDVTYTPNADFNGSDQFSYTISDGNGGTDAATVTITVDPVNDAPTAVDDAASTNEDVAVTIDVIANDDDIDGDTLTVSAVTQGTDGSVTNNGTDVTYTPDADFFGTDTFTYTISDGSETDVATVTVTVTEVNDAPTANAGPDQSVLVTDVVQLDGSGSSDPEGDTLDYQWSVVSGPGGANVSFSDETVQSPTATFSDTGTYVLQLVVSDQSQSSAPDTVTIVVNPAPVINIDNVSVAEGDTGTTSADFTVSLSFAVDRVVTVSFSTSDGTAQAGSDYVAATGIVTFPASSTAPQTISIDVNGDIDVEPNETFNVNLSSPVNATIGDGLGVGTIQNDDAAASLTLTPTSINLFTGDVGQLTVTLSIPAPAGGTTVILSSDNTAIATAPASVVVPGGANQATFDVTAGLTAGVAAVTASSAGFTSDSSNIVVTARALSLTLDSPLVGVGRSIDGTVALASAAPAGGVEVTLSSQNDGIATVAPETITIPEGETSVSISVTGVAPGTVEIEATAPGYVTATDTITVTSSLVSFGTIPDVAPGQSVSLAVSLSDPAPTGGVTISLVSDDPSIATIDSSVFIAGGATTPAANPQVTGILIGTATMQATAPGFAPDSRDVTVTLDLVFNPDPFDIIQSETSDIALNLSAPAPSGGLTIDLSSDDPLIASVPAQVTVGAGETSVFVPVTGEAVGTTTVRANSAGIAEETVEVNVDPAPPINLSDANIGDDLQVAIFPTLGQAAPAGNLIVTFESSDPARLLISTDANTVGQASVTAQYNAGSSSGVTLYLQALDDNGSATVTATATGYATSTNTVELYPSGFAWFDNSFTTTTFSGDQNKRLQSVRLQRGDLTNLGRQSTRGGVVFDVAVASTDTAVGTVDSPVSFGGNTNIEGTTFTSIGAGATDLKITQPAGFQVPANLNTTITGTVTAPAINANDVAVGDDLQVATFVSMGAAPPTPTDFTLTIADPSIAAVSADAVTAGGADLTILGVTSSSIGNIYVQGLQQGSTTMTIEAPGFASETVNIQVDPSGFAWFDVSFTTNTFASDALKRLQSVRLRASDLVNLGRQSVRAGLTVNVDVTNSDPTVGTYPATITFPGNSNIEGGLFDPANAGTVDLTVVQPAGFETPSNLNATITGTVTAPAINFSDINVGDDLQVAQFGSLAATPPVPTDVTFTVADPSIALVTRDASQVGTASVTIDDLTNTSLGSTIVQGLQEGSTTITITAAGYETRVATVNVDPSGFAWFDASFTTTTLSGNTNRRMQSVRLRSGDFVNLGRQPLRAGLSVDVSVTSSTPGVGTIESPYQFGANESLADGAFDPLTAGTTDLEIVAQPAGFQQPSNLNQTITATVNAPGINLSSGDRVGEDLQIPLSIFLEVAPPAPADVTVTVASGTIVTLSDDATVEGGSTVTFTGVTGTFAGNVFVQGRNTGSTVVTVQAGGYADGSKEFTVDPSGFTIPFNNSLTTTAGAANSNIQMRSSRLDPVTLNRAADQAVRGGLTVSIDVANSNPAVGTLTLNPVIFNPNTNVVTTQFDPDTAGSTVLTIQQPPGFDTPSNGQVVNVTVNP